MCRPSNSKCWRPSSSSILSLRQLERADDVRERKGVGLAGDLHQQRADDGERHRQLQLKARALARLRRDAHGAAHLLDHVLHDVEADAAAGDVGDACPSS